jgi:hypothetical protein
MHTGFCPERIVFLRSMRQPRFFSTRLLYLLIGFTSLFQIEAQEFHPTEIVNQNLWKPKETGAIHCLPQVHQRYIKKASIEVYSEIDDLFLAIQQVHQAAIKYQANGFFPKETYFDSTSNKYVYVVSLFALNQFDVDNLPFLPNGLYILNPMLHTNGREKEILTGAYSIVLNPDTFYFLPGFEGGVLYLDGFSGAAYRWKKRKLESDFVFSTRGSNRSLSYRTPFSKKRSIYVSLTMPLGCWYLMSYGANWWTEEEPIIFPTGLSE